MEESMCEPDIVEQKKKRGRKKKSLETNIINTTNDENHNITITIEENPSECKLTDTTAKKRGRKPKGGKLILKHPDKLISDLPIANIILHLKCSIHDLNEYKNAKNQIVTDPHVYNPLVPPVIMSYNQTNETFFSNYEVQMKNTDTDAYNELEKTKNNNSTALCSSCTSCNSKIIDNEEDVEIYDEPDINIKDINQKLKKIKLQLYKNTNPDKKSACFWCTYEYDNPSCYIPKYEMDNQLYGYGSFCRPECAVAFLMKENLDDSTKFERYHLLNQIYSKIYEYKKNIKPAPNPYFLLDKFYGNLSIQEYRKLLKTEHMLLVIEKPMTRILPELHEDNDDFIMNLYGSTSASSQTNQGVYKVKRQSEKQKGPSKKSIMKESFGIA
jgi:hypothetical protein